MDSLQGTRESWKNPEQDSSEVRLSVRKIPLTVTEEEMLQGQAGIQTLVSLLKCSCTFPLGFQILCKPEPGFPVIPMHWPGSHRRYVLG